MTVDVNASASTGLPPAANAAPMDVPEASPDGAQAEAAPTEGDRDYTFYRHNSLSGATGLLHTIAADSSAPGTFRLSIVSNYFSGSGFLCPNRDACPPPPASIAASETQDTLDRVGADLTLSATLLPFLEAYAGMHSYATSDNFGRPQLLQVLGDTNIGLKGFLPRTPDNIFSVGALGDLRLLNGSGSVGVHTANVSFRALGTVDLTNRRDPQQRIPLRFHANFGYLFENSSSIISNYESAGYKINRIERFGLDINRVDTMFIGIGAEYVHPVVQPFAEWSIDIPSNRQGYICRPGQLSRGDDCLKRAAGFSATPSRLTFGLRATPWIKGFNATLALDVGTGATSRFIEEIAPQLPWNLYFGIGFTYDTLMSAAAPTASAAPQVIQLPPPAERHIVGVVIDEKTLQPIPNAIIKFPGRTFTGLVTRADGSFETGNLDYGEYSMSVSADGYKEGSCTASVSATTNATSPSPMGAPPPGQTQGFGFEQGAGMAQPGAQPGYAPNTWNGQATPPPLAGAGQTAPQTASGANITSVQCILKPAPIVGIIQGTLIDAEASTPVPGARITVRDSRGREVEVQTDESGNFRFENVPAGVVHLSVDANGYLPSATDLEVKQKGEQRASLTLNKRPKKPSVSIVGKEVKLTTQVHFGTNQSNILPDSQALLQEVAALLTQHAEVRRVEIQGHTDDTGGAAHNKRLSQDRAEAVRTALISLGVDASRLTAVGYGADKPLVPNSSEANRARNRRVQLMILERQP